MDLIPPSHFGASSSNTSPVPTKRKNRNVVLKTPDDFLLKSPERISGDHTFTPPSMPRRQLTAVTSQKVMQPRSHSAPRSDSGYAWSRAHSVGEPDLETDAGHQERLRQLRVENSNLKTILANSRKQQPSVAASGGAHFDVITHQVQFIERLQNDINGLTAQLGRKDQEILGLERNIDVERGNNEKFQQDIHLMQEQHQRVLHEKSNVLDTVSELRFKVEQLEKDKQLLVKSHESELSSLQASHTEQLAKVEEDSRIMKEEMMRGFGEERASWKNNALQLKEETENKINQSTVNQRKVMEDLAETHKKENLCLKEDLKRTHENMESVVENEKTLKNTISRLQTELQNSNEELNGRAAKMQDMASALDKEKEVSFNLRSYVAKIQADNLEQAQWKEDKNEMLQKFQSLEEEKVELIKTLEVLNVRFQAVSKILETQEASITAHTNAMPDVHRQNKAGVVTSQWRAKVFELMVQCKSQEIVTRQEGSKYKIAIKDLQHRLEEEERRCSILSSRVEDLDAQLQLKEHIQLTQDAKSKQMKEENVALKAQVKSYETSMVDLHQQVRASSKQCDQTFKENQSKCLEELLRLEQRLAFANNRLRTLQDLLTRRDTMWRIRLQQTKENLPQKPVETNPRQERVEVAAEVLKLMEERDMLSQRLANDAASFEQSAMASRRKEENLMRINQDLEKQIIKNEEDMESLKLKLDEIENRTEELNCEKDGLREKLVNLENTHDKAITEAANEAERRHGDEVREQENKLNQTKRELAKSVVALRQAERSAVREKTRHCEQLDLERRSWLAEEEKLRADVTQLQKDNNLMMTTLRQEGLVSMYKAARGKPKSLADDDSSSHKRVHFAENRDPDCPDQCEKSTDVSQLLKDLTNLSENVLKESESD